ncbi:hypothetical protein J6590_084948 [Homalodisca vitripennis]|nr:hypothetical protein J6590_084948 [Homalodisca vitripennis]
MEQYHTAKARTDYKCAFILRENQGRMVIKDHKDQWDREETLAKTDHQAYKDLQDHQDWTGNEELSDRLDQLGTNMNIDKPWSTKGKMVSPEYRVLQDNRDPQDFEEKEDSRVRGERLGPWDRQDNVGSLEFKAVTAHRNLLRDSIRRYPRITPIDYVPTTKELLATNAQWREIPRTEIDSNTDDTDLRCKFC